MKNPLIAHVDYWLLDYIRSNGGIITIRNGVDITG